MSQKYNLSILIPARNEEYLKQTIDDILKNIRGNTEIIVALDGQWPLEPLPQHERLTIVYLSKSIGQRASTNLICRLSQSKYIMKCDAHCSFDEGFDVKMMDKMKDHYTLVPLMKNMHVFNWHCKKCGKQWYQGRTPDRCYLRSGRAGKDRTPNPDCDNKTDFEKITIWKPNPSPTNVTYRFDKTLHFQYWRSLAERPEIKKQGDVIDSMSIQGSCWMLTRDKYWELNICDEGHGSWGQQGTEVACKTWLSGGEVKINLTTWYAHLFRTQGGDFGFPYPLHKKDVEKARQYSRNLWLGNNWPKAKHDLDWLIKKFSPVPEWDEDIKKGIIYYTDNTAPVNVAKKVQGQLRKIGLPILSVSLKPMPHFGKNIHFKAKRGYLTMFKQILLALEMSEADMIFFCEHDVLYHPSHFDFTPIDKERYYYNTNVWKLRAVDGHAVKVDDCKQLSGLCCWRDLAIRHFKKRIELAEKNGFTRKMGFEPGTHSRTERVDDFGCEAWQSKYPNIDIRHKNNSTESRWSKEQFRNQKFTKGWQETDDEIEGWGATKDIL